ncbi:MAG: UDP-N-acetylmuramoyl-L-alanyl-D-glutamate--2,6-diaminopimelate ligase, partial [Bacteroidota bacterium]
MSAELKLDDVLKGVQVESKIGSDLTVAGIKIDSRKVEVGDMFIALSGEQVDGHDYIKPAIDRGATSVMCERLPDYLNENVTYIRVEDSRYAAGVVASTYYGDPSARLKVVGVTGTNGKTTVASLLYRLFKGLGYKVGLVSTIEILVHEKKLPSTLTTPDVVSLHRLFRLMVDEGCDYVFMEVSSHAVVQRRITGVTFCGGVFTNISHDHLDYHGTFKNYIRAKQLFFEGLDTTCFALTNIDDRNGEVMIQTTNAKVVRYSLQHNSEFKAKVISEGIEGIEMDINGLRFFTRMVGRFNVYNLTAVYAVASQFDMVENEEIVRVLSSLRNVKGRMEMVSSKPRVIVDYAHTPDALHNVLLTLQKLRPVGKVITVVGCGGNRDQEKRPRMGRIAEELSDLVILTSDNPRDENPDRIIEQMMEGIPDERRANVLQIVDRKNAIKTSLHIAESDDIILISGKGH